MPAGRRLAKPTSAIPLTTAGSPNREFDPKVSSEQYQVLLDDHAQLKPQRDHTGTFQPRSEYEQHLLLFTQKKRLLEACEINTVKYRKRDNVQQLRALLADFWYKNVPSQSPVDAPTGFLALSPQRVSSAQTSSTSIKGNTYRVRFEEPQAPSVAFASTRDDSSHSKTLSSQPIHQATLPHSESSPTASHSLSITSNVAPSSATRPQATSPRLESELQPLGRAIDDRAPPSPHFSSLTASAIAPIISTSFVGGNPGLSPLTPVPIDLAAIDPTLQDESAVAHPVLLQSSRDDEDDALVRMYGIAGTGCEDVLGYCDNTLDEDEDDEFVPPGEDEEEEGPETEQAHGDDGSIEPEDYEDYEKRIRVDASSRFEKNRRKGGRQSQKSVEWAWNNWAETAIASGQIRDEIPDEHSLLVFIKAMAERPRLNPKREPIPGTFIGASQLKKLFFGALRIRKQMDARDKTLARRRPAQSIIVFDEIKCRMDAALNRAREGKVPGEDAPDIVANTFLSGISEEQIRRIGFGFLSHRLLKSVIMGHLSWTAQHASGNRSDDIRSLKLAEINHHSWLHPNGYGEVYSIVGMQGEEKAGKKGMKTTINPVYSYWCSHADPFMDPLGAYAFYFHWLHDVYNLTEKLGIDWTLNKSWRQCRLLFGSSPIVPYNEGSMYNLFRIAFKAVNFESSIVLHLARHLVGYRQAQLGISPLETSKLGWSRGTYIDVYAPQIPRAAVLGCHGYKVSEEYCPPSTLVRVPERFLLLVCQMAESIYKQTDGKENYVGVTEHWKMVAKSRERLFQCGAAIYQEMPKSKLFKLPAFQDPDVVAWMRDTFVNEYSMAKASRGAPVDLQRVQNEQIRLALEESRALLQEQNFRLLQMFELLKRRTSALSPATGFNVESYNRQYQTMASYVPSGVSQPTNAAMITSAPVFPAETDITAGPDALGIYISPDGGYRAFVTSPPTITGSPQIRTEVDPVLPPKEAFVKPGFPMPMLHPCFGQRLIKWEAIFPLVHQPMYLWDAWKPECRTCVRDLWVSYSMGEEVKDQNGNTTGVKPPLRLVEEQWPKGHWRSSDQARQAWHRYREIPEYIARRVKEEGVSIDAVIAELEQLRAQPDGRTTKTIDWLGKDLKAKRLAAAREAKGIVEEESTTEDGASKRKRKKVVDSRRVKAKLM